MCRRLSGKLLNLSLLKSIKLALFFFLVGYVEERLWWPIQSPNIGRMKKVIS